MKQITLPVALLLEIRDALVQASINEQCKQEAIKLMGGQTLRGMRFDFSTPLTKLRDALGSADDEATPVARMTPTNLRGPVQVEISPVGDPRSR